MTPPPLSDIEIHRELNAMDGWSRRGDALVKTYEFPTFAEAIAWVNRVAAAAEAADHHPDLDIRFRQVIVSLTTHDSGGITALDFAVARAMDLLVGPGEPPMPER
ncbi:MAG: 4a-hydroxytetrahydrobiopterin dehydratase, partial [Gemmatimonadaceae bacterium]|nr:4a-hydroxytetrahydrobiopterin dehydratase [Gemmatimonadaceae bacterium]